MNKIQAAKIEASFNAFRLQAETEARATTTDSHLAEILQGWEDAAKFNTEAKAHFLYTLFRDWDTQQEEETVEGRITFLSDERNRPHLTIEEGKAERDLPW